MAAEAGKKVAATVMEMALAGGMASAEDAVMQSTKSALASACRVRFTLRSRSSLKKPGKPSIKATWFSWRQSVLMAAREIWPLSARSAWVWMKKPGKLYAPGGLNQRKKTDILWPCR